MKYLGILLIILIAACNSGEKSEFEKLVNENQSNESINNKKLIENLRIDYKEIIEPIRATHTIIPIILEEKYYDKGISEYSYSNVLFHDRKSGENNFLFEDSIDFIASIKYFEKTPEDKNIETNDYDELEYGNYGSDVYKYLFYIIKPWKTKKELEEYSENPNYSYSKLKTRWRETGPSTLCISDYAGRGLLKLTPEHARVITWNILKNSNIILAKVLIDSNNDKKFNEKDNIKLLRIDLSSPKIGSPVLNQEQENTLKKNLLKGKTGI